MKKLKVILINSYLKRHRELSYYKINYNQTNDNKLSVVLYNKYTYDPVKEIYI